MDLALTINGWIDEEVIFAQQLGARQVFARVDSSPGWEAQSLTRLANRIEKAGLALAGLHAAGAPAGEERQGDTLAWLDGLVQEAGTARIGLLSLSAALFPARRSVDHLTAAQLASLADTANRAGVKLAIPAAALEKKQSVRQAQGSQGILDRVLQSLPPTAGLDGSPGLVLDWLEKTAPRQPDLVRLYLVSFENEQRTAGKLNGAGFDELLPLCWRLREAGYRGLIRLGQPSRWKGDTRDGHHARAFATGYLRAVLQAFDRVDMPR
jgi:hypothetical protein